MFETMKAFQGVGLAAPQIGLSFRLFVMDCEGLKLVDSAEGRIVLLEHESQSKTHSEARGETH